ncbi:2Fe-2S iron-sulfur cluster binding domain-containing protein [Methylocystis parvus]|uniref:2Fe-2S iron-sulfur cluster binding domain-containing protein n=1 Tax=Methylocystis parvus TaxID=134 RepID=A0A6B8MGF7_9HYPH|nr:2Fe-2S iron-sulfur cluster binding domain-containing protein [Methylocystis parvus]
MLIYKDRPVDIAPGETVLDALLRAGVEAPYSCRAGNCQTCLHRAVEGAPPAESQRGLTEAQKALGFFLPCICTPKAPLAIAPPDDAGAAVEATVREIAPLSHDIVRLRIETSDFAYRPGQFLELIAAEDLKRHYSLASHPEEDPFLELHIRLHAGGRMSRHVREILAPGHKLQIAGPRGTCFYEGVEKDQPLILIGAGTGLAPLYGVLRDALRKEHRGPIRLYHGARERKGLYLMDELAALAKTRDNVDYLPATLDSGGDIAALALEAEKSRAAHSAFFLCGGEALVKRLKRDFFMSGASMKAIRSDVFTPAGKSEPAYPSLRGAKATSNPGP